ncbi:ribosome maturation factor RimP [Candidatus Endomicrobiellum trichonymphae]|uniref:Ribosome maturation factor RimP n=1 Tax=Endomicrobium trichonymphae TaxID=1408204 RepID=A0A1E5ILR0_ENDTX|nr:ribosome maturation factor RimP [Candidatus Endomicrobium trichonymphae]
MKKAQKIEDLLAPVAASEKIEIVDVQYVKEAGDWVARIFIDKDGGVTINDCENISCIFSAFLDESDSDILKDSYVLEISSPGFNRVLKNEKNFRRFVGSKTRIQTFKPINNQRNFLGTLLNFEDGKIKIDDAINGIVEIEFSDIKKANIETDI